MIHLQFQEMLILLHPGVMDLLIAEISLLIIALMQQ